jgi:hypothetical protein
MSIAASMSACGRMRVRAYALGLRFTCPFIYGRRAGQHKRWLWVCVGAHADVLRARIHRSARAARASNAVAREGVRSPQRSRNGARRSCCSEARAGGPRVMALGCVSVFVCVFVCVFFFRPAHPRAHPRMRARCRAARRTPTCSRRRRRRPSWCARLDRRNADSVYDVARHGRVSTCPPFRVRCHCLRPRLLRRSHLAVGVGGRSHLAAWEADPT